MNCFKYVKLFPGKNHWCTQQTQSATHAITNNLLHFGEQIHNMTNNFCSIEYGKMELHWIELNCITCTAQGLLFISEQCSFAFNVFIPHINRTPVCGLDWRKACLAHAHKYRHVYTHAIHTHTHNKRHCIIPICNRITVLAHGHAHTGTHLWS